MTQDEIMEMARQTGWHDALLDVSFVLPTLTDFAKLVAAKAIAELESQEPFPPAQRTWIGLTDDEFNELYDRYVPLTCYALLIEKVEAKLKEKNT
jgi:hypothetical protein